MGLFDIFLSPEKKCEKQMTKLLNDVVVGFQKALGGNDGKIKKGNPAVIAFIMPAIETLKEERSLQKFYGLSDEVYDRLIFEVSNKVIGKYIPNWKSILKESFSKKVEKEQNNKSTSKYKLLYFISRCDTEPDENGMWGTTWAKPLIERQNNLFRQDPPPIPMESIVLEEREDLMNKYNIGCFPCVVLIDKDGNKINEWRGDHITGTMISKYMQENSLS